MSVLSSKKVLQDSNTRDPNAITTLTLTHKALSDVSCLSEFKNLERLDLAFNNLSSLEGLKSCVNLKWLSVAQNKLRSLKGIEGLTKLTVLNAGKNKLISMNEVRSLVNLRALILNDNEIVSVCSLDQMRELNTLVLSRNPICEIGDSLVKVKSITKLSLSNCQLQTIGPSLKSCIELKELRLAHNDIKTLPAELACNTKARNLDFGNNLIASWSDLKVLSTLVSVRNLNLQGNPVAEKDKLTKKIQKLMPNLKIFNARPIDKALKNEKGGRIDRVDDFSLDVGNKLVSQKEEQIEHDMGNKNSKHHEVSQNKDGLDNAVDLDMEKGLRLKNRKRNESSKENDSDHTTEKKVNKKLKKVEENENNDTNDVHKESKHRKQKANEHSKEKASHHKGDSTITEKELKKKSKKVKQNEVSIIDDGETPLMDLFATGDVENAENSNERDIDHKTIQDVNLIGVVTLPKKRKKIKSRTMGTPLHLLSPAGEVGLGGASTWDDE